MSASRGRCGTTGSQHVDPSHLLSPTREKLRPSSEPMYRALNVLVHVPSGYRMQYPFNDYTCRLVHFLTAVSHEIRDRHRTKSVGAEGSVREMKTTTQLSRSGLGKFASRMSCTLCGRGSRTRSNYKTMDICAEAACLGSVASAKASEVDLLLDGRFRRNNRVSLGDVLKCISYMGQPTKFTGETLILRMTHPAYG